MALLLRFLPGASGAKMPGRIHAVVQYPDNENLVAVQNIEDDMA